MKYKPKRGRPFELRTSTIEVEENGVPRRIEHVTYEDGEVNCKYYFDPTNDTEKKTKKSN